NKFAGDSWDARSVIKDSALGLLNKAPPSNFIFLREIDWLENYLGNYPAPKYPFPIDPNKAAAGKTAFDAQCARCHWSERTGTVLKVEEVGTDPERKGPVEENPLAYVASFPAGIWLRAPYLHTASVPSLRALLKPANDRPSV